MGKPRDPLFSAAVLKLAMAKRGMSTNPGFRVVYMGTLGELGVTDSEVDAYISEHREQLEAHIEAKNSGT